MSWKMMLSVNETEYNQLLQAVKEYEATTGIVKGKIIPAINQEPAKVECMLLYDTIDTLFFLAKQFGVNVQKVNAL